jgi:UDP-glucose 4-epimerase
MNQTPYRGARVLILGSAGFIGRWVARRLTELGADLHLVARDSATAGEILRQWKATGSISLVDLTRLEDVRTLIEQVKPAIIFNLAGYGVDPSERDAALASTINADLPPLLAEKMGSIGRSSWHGQHVIHVGSALEYGTASGDLDERTTAIPTTLYGRTKLAGTQRLHDAARDAGSRATTARLFTVYGAGELPGRLVPTLIDAASGADPINLTAGTQLRDFTYVEDVVEGLLRLGVLSHASFDVPAVNVATGTLTTVRRMIETAAAMLNIDPDRLRFGALPTRQEEMNHDPVTIQRLRSLTGWSPATALRDGLAKTLVHE